MKIRTQQNTAEVTELCTTYQFQKNLSNQINRCGPTLHAHVQLSRSGRCSSQQKTQVLN